MENHERNRAVGRNPQADWSNDVGSEPSRRGRLGGMESGKSEKDVRSEDKKSDEIKYPSKPGSNF